MLSKYPNPAPADLSPYVDGILTGGANGGQPDVAYCSGQVECLSFYSLLTARGFKGIFWHSLYSDALVKPLAGSIVSNFANNPSDTSAAGVKQMQADIQAYEPGGKIDTGTTIGYTSADLFITALKKAAANGKSGITPDNVRKVASTMTWKIDGLAGPVVYPDATVISHPACWVVMLSDGTSWNTVSPYACSNTTYKPNSFKAPSS